MADAILKRCCTCKQEKPVSDFGRCQSTNDGLRKRCKHCNNVGNAEYRSRHPEASRAASLIWQKANRSKANAKHQRFLARNPGYMSAKQKEWRERNPEGYAAVEKRARKKHAVHRSIADRVRKSLMNKASGTKTFELLGYTVRQLKAHLELQFEDGMNWENFGKWHIDHITPLSSFTINDQDDPELRTAWCLSNLRPLWATENLKKSAKRTHLI